MNQYNKELSKKEEVLRTLLNRDSLISHRSEIPTIAQVIDRLCRIVQSADPEKNACYWEDIVYCALGELGRSEPKQVDVMQKGDLVSMKYNDRKERFEVCSSGNNGDPIIGVAVNEPESLKWLMHDASGNEYEAMVEFVPDFKLPNQQTTKKDSRFHIKPLHQETETK